LFFFFSRNKSREGNPEMGNNSRKLPPTLRPTGHSEEVVLGELRGQGYWVGSGTKEAHWWELEP
jgi:hypothetical protein